MDAVQFQNMAALLRPRLLNIALRYLHQKEEAEDVVQDALLRVWQLDLATAADVERLSGVVVKNLCIDLLRRRRVKVSLDGMDIAAADDELDTRYERVMALIDKLPPMQQIMMRLRHIEQKEYADIAALLHISPSAVRQNISRARLSILKHYHSAE